MAEVFSCKWSASGCLYRPMKGTQSDMQKIIIRNAALNVKYAIQYHQLKLMASRIQIYNYMKGNQSGQQQPPVLTAKKSSTDAQDYEDLGQVGKGAYGKVSLAKKNGKLYAIKQIEKKKLAKESKEYQAFVEKELLRKLDHPGIIKLIKCYQDKKCLNYVLEYCHGGDFTNFIRFNNKYFTEEMRVFYVAQIVSILEYLHSLGITHRDLKPENIMLSKEGHLKLIDFGTAQISQCKIVEQKFKEDIQKQKASSLAKKSLAEPTQEQKVQSQQDPSPRKRRSTFVGTCFYLSPELLQKNICEPPSDLWALGCIIYQLYYLQPPFKAANQYQLFQRIKNVQIGFPKNEYITQQAIDLIKKLLVKIPQQRLGSNSKEGFMVSDLKAHPYFKNINFENLFTQSVPPLIQQHINKEEHELRLNKLKAELEGDFQEILADKQNIIYNGIIESKSFATYNVKYLVLKKGFQIYKWSPHSQQPRKLAVIPLKEDTVAELIDDNKFRINIDECPQRIRTLQAAKWVEVLNEEYRKSKKQ